MQSEISTPTEREHRLQEVVLEYLQAAGLTVVVVDTACPADDPRLRGARLVSGDCRRREVLEAAGIADAGGVLLLTSDDQLNITAALVVRALNPETRVVLRMFNESLIGRLGQAVQNVYALSTSLLTAPILALTALTGQGLGIPTCDQLILRIEQLDKGGVVLPQALAGSPVWLVRSAFGRAEARRADHRTAVEISR